ncbi:MAG TPA: hypothetical protein VM094_06995 [Gemmatimonadales bacterium]|nr:hypothetical protein [Gemmatimonadales bacterium]
MRSRRTISFSTLAASVLLLPACDGLLPDRRQPAFAAASVDSGRQVEQPKGKRRADSNARRDTTAEPVAAPAFDQIRRSLRVLVAAEQGFYAENGTYSGDLDRLAFRASGESQVKFLWVTRQGWAASGTHPAVPGRDCVVFVGVANAAPTTLRFTRSGREGVIVCDVQSGPRSAGGSAAPAPPPVADTGSALDAVNPTVQMRVDLRNLANAQTAYFATQGIYSIRPEQLQLQFSWQRGVNVTLLNADRTSWSARATHASRPDRSCVVWYGSPATRPATEAQRRVPDRAGVPACDD